MIAPDGSFRWIPNDVASQAIHAGGKPAVRITDPQGVQRWIPQNVAHEALEHGGKLVPVQDYPKPPTPSASSRFLSSAVAPFKGMVEAFSGTPTEGEKKQGLTSVFDDVVRPIERAVEAQAGQVDEARDLAKQGRYSEAAGHAIASVVPLVGPWVADTSQEFYRQLGEGNTAGALGTAAGNTALAVAPKVTEKVGGPVTRGLKEKVSSARENFGSARRTVGELAKKTQEENERIRKSNEDAVKAHRAEAIEAAHETAGREAATRQEVARKAEEISDKDATAAERERLAHEKEVRDVRRHNEKVRTKHAAVAKRINEENAAQEHTLQLRQEAAAHLKTATDQYRAQEEAVDQKAKQQENQAWSNWRTKVKGATLDGGEISGPLKQLRLDSPEVDRTLNQLEPRGDEVPQESPYARLRDQTSQSNFGASYDALSPAKQDAVDTMMQRSGESPDPISFDVEEGQPISVERVQRAYSILQRYIRSGRFEGPLLGEMKQVAKVLRRAVTKASEDHGAGEDLDRARGETIRYNEAFGRERPEPRTVRGEREKSANPEEVKRLQEEERLDAAAKYDPSLAEAQLRVKEAREKLKKLPSEDQLRKARKQVPAPPSENHPFEAYRLKPEPPEPPKRLTSGRPEERAAQTVSPPERVLPGDRPIETPTKKLNAKDIEEVKQHRLTDAANHIRHWGTYLGFVWPAIEIIRTVTRGEMPNVESTAASMVATPLAADAIARIIESPKMKGLLTRATPKDIAQIPEDLRGDLPQIVKAAQSRGIVVSPAMAALVGAAGRPQGPKTQQLQKTADEYRSAAQ